jgi:sugar transferase (PEP-CTERM system associated)
MVVLALLETLALVSVPYVAVYLRFIEQENQALREGHLDVLWLRALIFAAVMMTSLIAMGLYNIRLRASFVGTLIRIATSIAVGTAALVLILWALDIDFGGDDDAGGARGIIALMAAFTFIAVAIIRFAFMKIVDEDLFKRRVLVFGCGWQAKSIAQLRRRSDQRGFVIVGYIATNGEKCVVPPDRVLRPDGPLLDFGRAHRIDEIVVAMDDRRQAFPVQDLLECRLSGIEVVDLVSFLERETGKVRLDVLNPSWMIFGEGFRRDPVRLASERAFDVLAGMCLLIVGWPFMLLTALAIKLEDGWSAPVLYRQIRVGLEGRHFNVLKFRSMSIDAEQDGQARWAEKRDPRVTRVGSVIRKIRFDELPQIINVLRGDMSFVGPRPERPEFVDELNEQIPYYRERHYVKPGITGWAQLCYPYGSSTHDATEKLQYDLYYVKNHSLLFDLMILLQTAEVVLWGKGGR